MFEHVLPILAVDLSATGTEQGGMAGLTENLRKHILPVLRMVTALRLVDMVTTPQTIADSGI